MADFARVRGPGLIAARVMGVLLAAIGVVLAAGGTWLIVLGGSFYYLPAGVGLIAANTAA